MATKKKRLAWSGAERSEVYTCAQYNICAAFTQTFACKIYIQIIHTQTIYTEHGHIVAECIVVRGGIVRHADVRRVVLIVILCTRAQSESEQRTARHTGREKETHTDIQT